MKCNLSREYVSRVEFFKGLGQDKKVLHLGCSCGEFIRNMLSMRKLLHSILAEVTTELYGVDIHEESLNIMRSELAYNNLYHGDVERLNELEIQKNFDVVLARDLLEHISRPGAMQEGVKRYLKPNGIFFSLYK